MSQPYVPIVDQLGVDKPLLKWRRELKARIEEHMPSTWPKELLIAVCVIVDTWNPPQDRPVYWPDDTLDSWQHKLTDRFRVLSFNDLEVGQLVTMCALIDEHFGSSWTARVRGRGHRVPERVLQLVPSR